MVILVLNGFKIGYFVPLYRDLFLFINPIIQRY